VKNPINPDGMNSLKSVIGRHITFVNLLAGALCATYIFFFVRDLSPFWFNPEWTTDDAMQQVFPFYSVLYPGIFEDDLIFEAMRGYLAPLHFLLGSIFTWLTADPMLMAHWMMLVQIVSAAVFLFLAVKHSAGIAPAFFAVAWFFHTRPIMQRITAGLPRGWGAAILAGFLYFALTRNHKGMLVLLLLGCLLHPPATFMAAFCYGLILVSQLFFANTRPQARKYLLTLILLSPIYLALVYQVVKRPEHIGNMATFAEAEQLPEFSHPSGRFPFVPLPEWRLEMRDFSFDAFMFRFREPQANLSRSEIRNIAVGSLIFIVLVGLFRRRRPLPLEVCCYLGGIVLVYFASRELAFRLYVPNRHLQFPMTFFFITAFSIALWRAFHLKKPDHLSSERVSKDLFQDSCLRHCWLAALAFVGLGFFIYQGSGSGLYGSANFNYSVTKKGAVWLWARKFTPRESLIAGHPTHIDGVQLFGIRRGYATTETAHPFYTNYFNEIKKRLEISLRAHYARDLNEFIELVEPEGIDFFVFEKRAFYPDWLQRARYFVPLNSLVQELTARPYTEYAFWQLPQRVDLQSFPAMPFRDNWSAVIDIRELRKYLDTQNPEPRDS
jgi:hypothetical protein